MEIIVVNIDKDNRKTVKDKAKTEKGAAKTEKESEKDAEYDNDDGGLNKEDTDDVGNKDDAADKKDGRGLSADVACEAEAREITRATERTRPESSYRSEFQSKVDAHQARHPGGILPSELRDFDDYMKFKKKYLNAEELQLLRCKFCGQLV